jgi:hypothetical protein
MIFIKFWRKIMQAILRQPIVAESDSEAALNLRITWKYLLAFFALIICTGEMHEQVHITTGRIICGSYGPRDFNAWKTAADCVAPSWAFLATLTGPLFSYAVMWTGAWLLVKAKNINYKAIGFSLVFAPLPFARIFTAVMGGGDEKVVLRALIGDGLNIGTTKILAAILVTAVCLPPLYIAWRNIRNRFPIFYMIGFLVLPLLILSVYVLTFLNGLLEMGFLSSAPISGTPLLVVIHSLLMAVLFIFCRRWLLEINANLTES